MPVIAAKFISLASKFYSDTFADFKQSIVFKNDVNVSDGQGGTTITYPTFATVDAFIFPLTGKEKVESGRLISDQLYKFLIQPVAGINTTMKITYNSEDYQIRSIKNYVESDVLIEIVCEKGVAQ